MRSDPSIYDSKVVFNTLLTVGMIFARLEVTPKSQERKIQLLVGVPIVINNK